MVKNSIIQPKDLNATIIAFSVGQSGLIPLTNLVEIVDNLYNNIILISGELGHMINYKFVNIQIDSINHLNSNNPIFRIINYIKSQIRIAYKLIDRKKNYNHAFFFLGGDTLVFPILIARIMKKKVIIVFSGSSVKTLEAKQDSYSNFLKLASLIGCELSDKIIVYSQRNIVEYNLERWNSKINIAHRHIINTDTFKNLRDFAERHWDVTYFGRLSEEKGVMNFVMAINVLRKSGLMFRIIGDGEIRNALIKLINDNGLDKMVVLEKWIDHDKIPEVLNDTKFTIIPSFTEGLPNAMLEAMACGSIVIANKVGGIEDIIKNGDTGFLMKSNSPEDIANAINMATSYRDFDKIICNAEEYILKEHTSEKIFLKWKSIIN